MVNTGKKRVVYQLNIRYNHKQAEAEIVRKLKNR